MLYFYLILFVTLLASGVSAQTCTTVNATFTVSPRVCLPSYLTTAANAADPTQEDALATFLNSLTTYPSQTCAKSFLEYYCSRIYPECASDNTTVKGQCRSTCINIATDCMDYMELFAGTDYPIPGNCPAGDYTGSGCTLPVTNTNAYYANCTVADASKLFASGTPRMCFPNYTIPVGYFNYTIGFEVGGTFRGVNEALVNGGFSVTNDMYPCFKALANYYCTLSLPSCPAGGKLTPLPICASACHEAFDACYVAGDNSTFIALIAQVGPLTVPSKALCNSLPTANCYTPSDIDTNVGFFFNGDPPVEIPTVAPTKAPSTPSKYPPGGPAVGGAIGAAVIVGLLLVIGLTTLAMRAQDSR